MRALLLPLVLAITTSMAFAQSDQFLQQRFPTLTKNSKVVVVSPDEYIRHHLQGVTTRYQLIAVPDGWNTDGYLVEVATGKKLIAFSGSVGRALIGGVTPGDQYLAAEKIFSNAMTIWDIETKKELRTLPKLESRIEQVSFSSNHKLVGVSCKGGEIVIWEIESGREVNRIDKPEKTLNEILEAQQKQGGVDADQAGNDLNSIPDTEKLFMSFKKGDLLDLPTNKHGIIIMSGWEMESENGETYHRTVLGYQAIQVSKLGREAVPVAIAHLTHPHMHIRYISSEALRLITGLKPTWYHFGTPGEPFNGNKAWSTDAIAVWRKWSQDHPPGKPKVKQLVDDEPAQRPVVE